MKTTLAPLFSIILSLFAATHGDAQHSDDCLLGDFDGNGISGDPTDRQPVIIPLFDPSVSNSDPHLLCVGDVDSDGIYTNFDALRIWYSWTNGETLERFVRGDLNGDGVLSNQDIAPFIALLVGDFGERFPEARPGPNAGDLNRDGVFCKQDIAAFVLALSDPAQYAIDFPAPNSPMIIGAAAIVAQDHTIPSTPPEVIIPGDLNGDGSRNNSDIGAFIAALTGSQEFSERFPGVNPNIAGDLNRDGTFNGQDIAPFIQALIDPAQYAIEFPAPDSLTTGGPTAFAVPEPSSLGVAATLLIGLSWRRSRRLAV